MHKNQKGIGHLELIVVVAVLAVVGLAAWRIADTEDETPQASQTTQQTVDVAEELPSDLGDIKTIDEVRTLVGGQTSSEIVEIELEVEDGMLLYIVKLADGSLLAFDANSGDPVAYEDSDLEIDEDETIPSNFAAAVSLQDAINIAQSERPESTLEKVELEVEDGVVVYSVRFTDDSRVDVSATDGSIKRLRDENGTDIIDVDDDFDDDGEDNSVDKDDDNDGIDDEEDDDDDNDGISDDEDDDDDNDGLDDDEDNDDDEESDLD